MVAAAQVLVRLEVKAATAAEQTEQREVLVQAEQVQAEQAALRELRGHKPVTLIQQEAQAAEAEQVQVPEPQEQRVQLQQALQVQVD